MGFDETAPQSFVGNDVVGDAGVFFVLRQVAGGVTCFNLQMTELAKLRNKK